VFLQKYEKNVVERWKRQQMKAATQAAMKEEKIKAKENARAAEREERRQQIAKRKEKEAKKERSKDKRSDKDRAKAERRAKPTAATAAAPKPFVGSKPSGPALPNAPPVPTAAAASSEPVRRLQRPAQELKSPSDMVIRARARTPKQTYIVRHCATDEQALAQYNKSAEGAHYRCCVARLPLTMSREEQQTRKERESARYLRRAGRLDAFSALHTSLGLSPIHAQRVVLTVTGLG
jgi:hypothetical protein